LERYRGHLFYYRKKNGEPLSFPTQRGMLVPLKGWLRWMAREKYIVQNPAVDLELPRLGRFLPKHALTRDEVESVLAEPNTGDARGLRDRALLETLYSTGMRRGECVQLKLHNVDFNNGTVFIRQGRGRKDRVIPIGNRALHWIEKYLTEVRSLLVLEPDDSSLFLSFYGAEQSRLKRHRNWGQACRSKPVQSSRWTCRPTRIVVLGVPKVRRRDYRREK